MSAIPALVGELEDRAAVPSLSMSHISDGPSDEQLALPFKLSGSQQKTAHAIQVNIERMIREEGLEFIGFATFTVGDQTPNGFRQVWDHAEASRRFNNLNRHVLPSLFSRAVIVTERHKSGAIHFHIVGALRAKADIRTGFDFESQIIARKARRDGRIDRRREEAYRESAHPTLRALWRHLRRALPGYGFGRSELTPVRKSGEAISGYVAKYLRKNLEARRPEDYRKKLVRYLGWNKAQLTANGFAWATPRAAAWRSNARTLAAFVGAGHANVAQAFGPRWGWKLTGLMNLIKGENQTAFAFPSYRDLVGARFITLQTSTHRWQKYHWREAA